MEIVARKDEMCIQDLTSYMYAWTKHGRLRTDIERDVGSEDVRTDKGSHTIQVSAHTSVPVSAQIDIDWHRFRYRSQQHQHTHHKHYTIHCVRSWIFHNLFVAWLWESKMYLAWYLQLDLDTKIYLGLGTWYWTWGLGRGIDLDLGLIRASVRLSGLGR